MNNAKTFAKIILASMGIFFILKLIPHVFQVVMLMNISKSLWPLLMSLFIIIIIILLLWYFFFHLRDWLAEKIIGVPTGYEFDEQANWFPAALRLICIFVGLYCLYNVVWNLTQILYYLQWHVERGVISKFSQSPLKEIIHMAIMFAAGIYFVYGAPHFVRWQVRKTIEQCKKLQNSESALD